MQVFNYFSDRLYKWKCSIHFGGFFVLTREYCLQSPVTAKTKAYISTKFASVSPSACFFHPAGVNVIRMDASFLNHEMKWAEITIWNTGTMMNTKATDGSCFVLAFKLNSVPSFCCPASTTDRWALQLSLFSIHIPGLSRARQKNEAVKSRFKTVSNDFPLD